MMDNNKINSKILIIPIGPPGCGKTSLGLFIKDYFSGSGKIKEEEREKRKREISALRYFILIEMMNIKGFEMKGMEAGKHGGFSTIALWISIKVLMIMRMIVSYIWIVSMGLVLLGKSLLKVCR